MSAEPITVPYGESQISFRLTRRDRKTLTISVSPNLEVEVIAPRDTPIEKVVDRVSKRARWIQTQLRFFTQFHPRTPTRIYASGETHRYLGRQYKLKVAGDIQQQVRLLHGVILVQSHYPTDPEATKTLLDTWLRERSVLKFRERVAVCQQRFSDPDLFAPRGVIIRQMRQRWGSMTPGGRLVLNAALIHASVDAIDYVITHELCHLTHANHGAEFFRLLGRVMPDWERRKLKLERQMA